jgi:RNA polymerase sigma-70 factor (family 1)
MQTQQSESWNEQDVLLKLKGGEESAFGELYVYYSEMIYARLLRLLKDQDMADEIIQELFLKVWEKRQQINLSQSFKSYVYTIAENLVYDHFRKVARDKKLMEKFRLITTELYTHIEEDLLSKESREMIDKAIGILSPQRKTAFILCKIEGKSYEEAAVIMGISPSTVSNHLVKASITLRAYIDKSRNVLPGLIIFALITIS